jgi:hypothetical protein
MDASKSSDSESGTSANPWSTKVMANAFRFGQRIKLPSTVEIKHELRMMMMADSIGALTREAAALKAAEDATKSLASHCSGRR